MLTARFKVSVVIFIAFICVSLISATQLILQSEINQIRDIQKTQINVENGLVKYDRLIAPTATPSPTLKVTPKVTVKPLQSATSSAK